MHQVLAHCLQVSDSQGSLYRMDRVAVPELVWGQVGDIRCLTQTTNASCQECLSVDCHPALPAEPHTVCGQRGLPQCRRGQVGSYKAVPLLLLLLTHRGTRLDTVFRHVRSFSTESILPQLASCLSVPSLLPSQDRRGGEQLSEPTRLSHRGTPRTQ
jgi:hypothetical protein